MNKSSEFKEQRSERTGIDTQLTEKQEVRKEGWEEERIRERWRDGEEIKELIDFGYKEYKD